MTATTFGVISPDEIDDLRLEDQLERTLRRRSWARRLLVLAPAALMLGLGFVGLDRHSVWRDEAASLVAARRSLPELWTMLGQTETVHAVYYTLLHVWLGFGTGEVWARVPSVLAMAVAVALVGIIGARVVSTPVGVLAGLVFAVNPSASFYAQEARSTALVTAVALLATWFLLQALERRPAWWLAYAAACTLLVGLNLLALLVPVAHALTLPWWRRPRRALLRWAVATGPALVVSVGLVDVTSHQAFQIAWIPGPSLAAVRDLAHLTLGPNLPVTVLGALLVLLAVLPTRSLPERRLQALAVPLAALPAAVLLAVSFVQPIFVPRYVFPSVAAVSLLLALGVLRLARAAARRTDRRAVVALVSCLTVLVLAGAGVGAQRLDRTPASRPDDLAAAARVVAAGAQPGDAMIFLPNNRRLLAQVYPEAFEGVHDVGLAEEADAAGNLTGTGLPVATTLQNLAASTRVWAIGRPGLAVLPSETAARAELDLLDRDFVPVALPGVRGVGITLYVRRPAAS